MLEIAGNIVETGLFLIERHHLSTLEVIIEAQFVIFWRQSRKQHKFFGKKTERILERTLEDTLEDTLEGILEDF